MMDAIKVLVNFGTDGVAAYTSDGVQIDTIEPVWTLLGSEYVTNITYFIRAGANSKLAMGLASAATAWAISKIKRLSLTITPLPADSI